MHAKAVGNPQWENMLQVGCSEADLPGQPAPAGAASLVHSLLSGAVPRDSSPLLDRLVAKLQRNGTVRILAAGMSVTAMFAAAMPGKDAALQHSPAAWSKCSQSAPLGSAPARLLRLLSVRLAAPGGSAIPE